LCQAILIAHTDTLDQPRLARLKERI
jgi:hypothetical protein